MVKCNKKIQFHRIEIDHYPLMPHNGISSNMALLNVLYWMNQTFTSMFTTELIGRYLDDRFVLSVSVLWEEDGVHHNSNGRRTIRDNH